MLIGYYWERGVRTFWGGFGEIQGWPTGVGHYPDYRLSQEGLLAAVNLKWGSLGMSLRDLAKFIRERICE
jgi:hypothetical protein